VIAILAVPYAIAAFKFRADSPEAQAYYGQVSARVRWEYGFYYVVLMVFLVFMMHDTQRQLADYRGGGARVEQPQGDDAGSGSV
jgi:hypothetical protein